MLASKPTSGLSLNVISDRDASFKNCVLTAPSSSQMDSRIGRYASRSNRFGGFSVVPLPRVGLRFGCSSMNLKASLKTTRVSVPGKMESIALSTDCSDHTLPPPLRNRLTLFRRLSIIFERFSMSSEKATSAGSNGTIKG